MKLRNAKLIFMFNSSNISYMCLFSLQRREALRCSLPNLSSAARPSCKSDNKGNPGPDPSHLCLLFHPHSLFFAAIHKSQPWFHGGVSRKEAQRLIEKQGLVDG